MTQWNPDQYLKFQAERTQPSVDLVNRIRIDKPATIIDIGCGPGNSTHVLTARWPDARTVGVDNSPGMIQKARQDYPRGEWLLADVSALTWNERCDIVFSNAALQWMPDHETLIGTFHRWLNASGALAVQVPANNESPLHLALTRISEGDKWRAYTSGCKDLFNYRSAEYYYPVLARLFGTIDMWETTYYHVMSSQSAVMEWYKGTGMRPFLERLPNDEAKRAFEEEVFEMCRSAYTVQENGKVLFPFKRLFFVAYK